jgi:CheY-like chemotaxis protein
MTVLIIDDDPLTVQLMSEMLTSSGFKVAETFSGVEGLQRAVIEQPDIIVLDLIMPGMNGFQVVQQLRTNPSTNEIPILVCTGKKLTETDRQRLENQVQAIAPKSGGKAELLQHLEGLKTGRMHR